MVSVTAISIDAIGARALGVDDDPDLVVDEIVRIVGKERIHALACNPCRLRIGQRDFFGRLARLPPPLEPPPSPPPLSSSLRAASRATRYSRTARDASSGFGQAIGWSPGTRFFLSTSALIRLASIENASPPTSPAAMHFATTPSKTRRKASLSRKRSCRARREHRMIGDLVLDAEPAKPSVGQIDLHLSANPPLRADRKHVADDQHPDHQHRIDRGSAGVRVVRRKLLVHPTEIEHRVDLADQMIRRHHLVEIERIKELALSILPPSHHRRLPLMTPQSNGITVRHRLNGSFATHSGPKRTWPAPVT